MKEHVESSTASYAILTSLFGILGTRPKVSDDLHETESLASKVLLSELNPAASPNARSCEPETVSRQWHTSCLQLGPSTSTTSDVQPRCINTAYPLNSGNFSAGRGVRDIFLDIIFEPLQSLPFPRLLVQRAASEPST